MGYCGKLPMEIYMGLDKSNYNNPIYFFMKNERLGEYMKIYFSIFLHFP